LIAGIRLPPLSHALELLVSRIELELGARLADLDRVDKQIAVRMLDEQGAFLLRKSIEYVADAMGVSRITIYNYLNAIKE
jgi:predicted transcriptional regulator YheO